MKHFNLEEFAGGKLSVQLNKALEKVTEKHSGSQHRCTEGKKD